MEGSYKESEHQKDLKYAPQAEEYSKKINGMKAYDGSTAKAVSCHAARRMDERKVPYDDVADTVANANISYPSVKHDNARVIRKGDTQAVYASDSGTVITVVSIKKE